MASAEDDLQCGLCLNTYKSPKFLPCHHTFCQGCVEDLVTNTGDSPLKCPKCRQAFRLPAGGVSQLQTNYYILPLLSPERCTLHRTETLRFYCTDCKVPICLNCRMTDHHKHEAQDLGKAMDEAKRELQECKGRLAESETVLSQQIVRVKEKVIFGGESHEALKRLVAKRLDQLTSVARECADDVVRELGTSFHKLQAPLLHEESCVEDRLSTVRALKQEVTQALDGASSNSLLTLSVDMRSGRGSDEQLRQLTSDLPDHTQRAVLRFEDNCVQRDVIRQYLGHVDLFQPIPLQQPVRIREMFRCCQDPQLYVHAVCVEILNNVCVAYGASGPGGEGRVTRYTQDGTLRETVPESIRGRVCLSGLGEGWVRVEGKEFSAKDYFVGVSSSAGNKATKRLYDVYNKGDARFVLRVHHSGLCDLWAVTIEDYWMTTDSRVWEVSAKTPIAMDVSRDGQLMAVLEEGLRHVMLYRHGNKEPHATYRGNAEAFRPLDACFYMIGGEERLVISGWLNALHVVEVGESCKLIGHVGWECPELVKPTALYTDGEGGRG